MDVAVATNVNFTKVVKVINVADLKTIISAVALITTTSLPTANQITPMNKVIKIILF